MTTTGTRLTPQTEPFSRERSPRERSPLAYLIHALNQPLTGLQCSLELAAASPRRTDQYVRTLREGLDLTARMRALVEAMRELSENSISEPDQAQPFELNLLLRDTVDDLMPVARQKGIQISLTSMDALEIEADRRQLSVLTFRLLDSLLSLAAAGSELRVAARRDGDCACLSFSWIQGPIPQHSPFSRPELGLIVARAGWEQASGEWSSFSLDDTQNCAIRLPLRSAAGLKPKPSCVAAASPVEGLE